MDTPTPPAAVTVLDDDVAIVGIRDLERLQVLAALVGKAAAAVQRTRTLLDGDITDSERADCEHELTHLMALLSRPLRGDGS